MRDVKALFADYGECHQTSGNKWFHRFGIPLIVLSLLGMAARVPWLAPALVVAASIYYLVLDPLLGVAMLVLLAVLGWLGSLLPFWANVAIFVLGWVFQFIGHAVYEKKQPAFTRNLVHLLVGPLWIVNGVLRRA